MIIDWMLRGMLLLYGLNSRYNDVYLLKKYYGVSIEIRRWLQVWKSEFISNEITIIYL